MFTQIRHVVSRWFLYSETVLALRAVDQHTLRDAGIDPERIRERARRAVRERLG